MGAGRNTISVGVAYLSVKVNTPRDQGYCSTNIVLGPLVTEYQHRQRIICSVFQDPFRNSRASEKCEMTNQAWQTLASHSMYQGTVQAQTSYSQSGLQNQRSQTAYSGQQAQQNIANVNNQQRPLNNGGVLLPGTTVPWTFPGQQSVTTGMFRGNVINGVLNNFMYKNSKSASIREIYLGVID